MTAVDPSDHQLMKTLKQWKKTVTREVVISVGWFFSNVLVMKKLLNHTCDETWISGYDLEGPRPKNAH